MSFSRSLKERSGKRWEESYSHPFVQELGAGTLDRESFKFYLLQDYIYLVEYAKVFAVGVVKSADEGMMANFTRSQHSILCREMETHRDYMRKFGISQREMEESRQSLFSKAYTSNMMYTATVGGPAEIISVVLPCAWSYYDYAARLKSKFSDTIEDNFYRSWIDVYSSEEYRESFEWLFSDLDRLSESRSQRELDALWDIFQTSVEFEYLFWDICHRRQMLYAVGM
ncbi:MAG: thiaminase II [Synergistaceae bacterium]|nr:thiaminase II [Synergistaceae bacterium]